MAYRISQKNWPVAVATSPLAEDALLLRHLRATDRLGRLFEYELEMLSEDPDIQPATLLGKTMAVRLGGVAGGKTRYFHGHVCRFGQTGRFGDYYGYRATLRPWLWFLTRTADCRIFQSKSVPEIIQTLVSEAGFDSYREDKLTRSYRTREYCVQYRETDFDFISRLMEQEGIYYFFEHAADKHTLVLADSYSSHKQEQGYETIDFYPPDPGTRRVTDNISEWSVAAEVASGACALDDYDFEKPGAELLRSTAVSRKHAESGHEIYDYPGGYTAGADGEVYSRVRIEELQAHHETVNGAGDARGLRVGRLFKLGNHPVASQQREYLVESATHELYAVEVLPKGTVNPPPVYAVRFTAVPEVDKHPFRAPRSTPRPFVQGPQTAVVVGPSGEEIYTDKYARVKVQFHWDREGKKDENSSCWVRVAQVWAGKNWGAMHIPRVGQEVVVDFLEGDPDRPLITGRVYNNEHMPPYALPANASQSGLKSRSTKSGDDKTFNELRFEDKKGSEEVYFHAEKNFVRVVENDDSLKVGFEKKDKGNQSIEIYNDRTLKVGEGSGSGSQTITIKKNLSTTVATGNDTFKVEQGNQTVSINKDQSIEVKTGNHSLKISAGKSVYEAAQSIELKVGASSIKLEPAKITLKSAQIAIEGSATVEIKGNASVKVESSAMLNVKGGAMATVEGGAMLNLKGGAMVNVQGGLVKIN